jgi:hypothetical protein
MLIAVHEDILTRRGFLKLAGVLAAPLLVASEAPPLAAAVAGAARHLKVVCVGGHPDDPESGCAGTLSRYTELGHSVTVLYLTRGERGIRDKSLEEAGKIRTAECEKACQVMGWGGYLARTPRIHCSMAGTRGRSRSGGGLRAP